MNGFTDVTSADVYWYTSHACTQTNLSTNTVDPRLRNSCRSASSYGKTVSSMRQLVAIGKRPQPVWNFVELLNGASRGSPFVADITPAQLKGAVMNSLINGAQGIVYFNQSSSGPCRGSALIRQSQYNPRFCATPNVAAMGQINRLIRQLAPVLNTQSYQFDFGTGLNTMLKSYKGSTYLFAMISGGSRPGKRTFSVPHVLDGKDATVVDEHRTIHISADGSFTDTFSTEDTYHIYRVSRG